MIDLVIFDMDGVLVDSEWLMALVWSDQLGLHEIDIPPRILIDRFAGQTDMSMADVIAAESGKDLPRDILDQIRVAARGRLGSELEALDGVDALLREMTHLRCICSNSAPDRIRQSLAVTGLDKHFSEEHLFSAADVPRPKPAPDLHLHAAGVLSIAPARAVVIEDSATGVAAARAAGMRVIGFTGATHIGDGHAEKLTAAGAESICPHMSEIPAHLARLG
ncbi:HAD family hydrolase [Hwanghaeella grinnelliae]|uniref:HAD family hydrolase n=1 Tax=Hwanghaeella grinnelliae TaxID=2500179 RepID=A0A437QPG4_9PROT|nr:HAD-IA family hydrolase [Hwanghaeella grinnelliae]RVU36349.1 HAD family hydrolase [Hwanghaeella grinnelliae]